MICAVCGKSGTFKANYHILGRGNVHCEDCTRVAIEMQAIKASIATMVDAAINSSFDKYHFHCSSCDQEVVNPDPVYVPWALLGSPDKEGSQDACACCAKCVVRILSELVATRKPND